MLHRLMGSVMGIFGCLVVANGLMMLHPAVYAPFPMVFTIGRIAIGLCFIVLGALLAFERSR